MKIKIFSVYDAKAEAFLQPFFAKATGQAIRSFTSAVNQPDHEFFRHAADYTLFYIGEFDEDTGTVEGLKNGNENLGNAITYQE